MTTTAVNVTRLADHQIAQTGPVLGRAFFDDPVTVYALPDEKKRARVLPWFFELGAKYAHRWGEVYTTGDTVEGAAMWLPPGDTITSPMRMLRVGLGLMPFKAGISDTLRFMGLTNVFEHLHKQIPPDHWYLFVLGVDTHRQGQGVGGSLIQPVLARADQERRICYLETSKEINVAFYRKHGFDVVVDDHLPKGGPRYWTMRREPKR